MEIKINLEHDSDNSMPGQAKITALAGSSVQIELTDPDRLIQLDAEDLLKILNILF